MRILAPVMFFVAASLCAPGAALHMSGAALANASTTTDASSSKFQVGSKPANSGRGFSLFSTFANSTYRVECNCADFSLDIRICNSVNYQCNCAPRATLSCAPL